jgi:hypothetical protein
VTVFKKSRPRYVQNGVQDQSRHSRTARVAEGRCPVHDKPLMQSDVWYRSKNGYRFTFVGCTHPTCRVEAVMTGRKFKLTKEWEFLLEQGEDGKGKLLRMNAP